ncbi:hypothetical protein [Listeria fleischmannii]|uniref:hypothetical protein n=1 Tax=Listeria fleischmannii TaxID=1069827 RepID=UPI0004B97C24|nr:hypothetical protein [Listeria fleischmannii]
MKLGYTIHEINQLSLDDLRMLNSIDFDDAESDEEEVEEITAEDFFKHGGFGF